MNPLQARADALAFLKRNFIATIATVSAAGNPQASLVYYACDDNFTIYFSTLMSTRKYANVLAHPRAAFTVATIDVPQTLQLEGDVSVVTNQAQLEENVARLIEPLTSNQNYQWPMAKLDGAVVALLRFTPAWARWGDFANFAKDSAAVFTEIPLA